MVLEHGCLNADTLLKKSNYRPSLFPSNSSFLTLLGDGSSSHDNSQSLFLSRIALSFPSTEKKWPKRLIVQRRYRLKRIRWVSQPLKFQCHTLMSSKGWRSGFILRKHTNNSLMDCSLKWISWIEPCR